MMIMDITMNTMPDDDLQGHDCTPVNERFTDPVSGEEPADSSESRIDQTKQAPGNAKPAGTDDAGKPKP